MSIRRWFILNKRQFCVFSTLDYVLYIIDVVAEHSIGDAIVAMDAIVVIVVIVAIDATDAIVADIKIVVLKNWCNISDVELSIGDDVIKWKSK